ncbi:hypothetical protein GGR53DRAFT_496758 [Hypoxylon sp. FL1150]|nr:hypothetical protein GGR53DRAFT_496758 [Hypoxylon sp. FL1150]
MAKKDKAKAMFMTESEPKRPKDIEIPSKEDPPCPGPMTDSSVYKSALLDKDDKHRYIKASHVREQVKHAPSKKRSIPGKKGKMGYPKGFGQMEDGQQLEPYLQSQAPRSEFPLVPGTNEPYQGNGPPGPLRCIYNAMKRGEHNVGYHSAPAGSGINGKDMRLSEYILGRKREEREENGEEEEGEEE